MQLLELNKKEMLQLKAELYTVKKDYEKLDGEQQRQGVGFHKYKTLARVSQEKAKKLSRTVDDVATWLGELKLIVNYEDPVSSVSDSDTKSVSVAGSDTRTAASSAVQIDNEPEGFLNTAIRDLERVLRGRDAADAHKSADQQVNKQ